MSEKVEEIIEKVLTDVIFLQNFDPLDVHQRDPFDKKERKKLAAAIAAALRKEFHMVPYAGQTSFE